MSKLNKGNTEIIIGNPGCGKTTELISRVATLLEAGVKPSEIAYCSFSVAAVEEAIKRATVKCDLKRDDFPFFRTLHSMAFQMLGLNTQQTMQDYHLREFGQIANMNFTSVDKTKAKTTTFATKDDKLLQIINVARLYDKPIRDYMIENRCEDVPVARVEEVSELYKRFKLAKGIFDYTDMLLLAKVTEMDIPDLKYLFVDEAQDLSTLQWMLVERMAESSENIVIAGDDKQCQPAGTQVLTSKGYKNIEDLDENTDRLISYAKRDSQCYGFSKGYAFKKKIHDYSGDLYSIETDCSETKATANHKWLVKWKSNKDTNTNVVYLMRQGRKFRIGWCQLFDIKGGFHLGVRGHKEKADAIWILKVCENKTDASMWESILSTNYGIPLVPFQEVNGAQHYTQKNLDFIFEATSNQTYRANRILLERGMSIDFPFLSKEKPRSRFGQTIFECESMNLLPELMLIPKMIKPKEIEWVPFDIEIDVVKNMAVYGLDVEKHHTYVTDGNIITHNSINEFAGADVDYFLSIDGRVTVLEQSYRVPERVFKLANRVVTKMSKYREEGTKWTHRGEEGFVKYVTSLPFSDMARGNWMILARTNGQLNDIKTELLRNAGDFAPLFTLNDQPPIDMDVFRAIKLFEIGETPSGRTKFDLVQFYETDTDEERKKKLEYITLFKKFIDCSNGNKQFLQPWEITDSFKHSFAQDMWMNAFNKLGIGERRYINFLRKRCEADGADTFKDVPIKLLTVHAAKGSEADNVIVLTNVPRAVQNSIQEQESDTEVKVFYVAVTRAKKKLYLMTQDERKVNYKTYL